MKTIYNYIIVGQGIAGTILARTFIKQNKTVLVIDNPSLSQSSRIAAGLYNPVVFKRLVKSWMVDELIPIMESFYLDSERLLNTTFYYKKEIIKLFADEPEKLFWQKKNNEEVGIYLSKLVDTDFLTDIINNPAGASKVLNAGNLYVEHFLNSFKNYFKLNNCLLEEIFDYNKLVISDSAIRYKGFSADKIIFCEGYKSIDNPYFNWLPFKLTKGEIITVKISNQVAIQIGEVNVINKGVFILPIGNGLYIVGATYEWNDLTEDPTEKGKSELIDKLKKVFKFPFEVVNHQAGIRPTVKDRRPLIGLHPKYSSIGIFNGMGTKGVMLAPYFAKQFADYLEEKTELNKEVDIARFNNQV